ncbi:hypothetical protein Avbf_02671 [Armadillidium vulgare]|nr:hypothetical protein Avbf_02671 [Armadillidium vulgare]
MVAYSNLIRAVVYIVYCIDLDTSEDGSYSDFKDKSVRVTTPVSDIELLDSLSLSYDSHQYKFLNRGDYFSSESVIQYFRFFFIT